MVVVVFPVEVEVLVVATAVVVVGDGGCGGGSSGGGSYNRGGRGGGMHWKDNGWLTCRCSKEYTANAKDDT
jgi:hypothetical protein